MLFATTQFSVLTVQGMPCDGCCPLLGNVRAGTSASWKVSYPLKGYLRFCEQRVFPGDLFSAPSKPLPDNSAHGGPCGATLNIPPSLRPAIPPLCWVGSSIHSFIHSLFLKH